jgi:hypothetical protein
LAGAAAALAGAGLLVLVEADLFAGAALAAVGLLADLAAGLVLLLFGISFGMAILGAGADAVWYDQQGDQLIQ